MERSKNIESLLKSHFNEDDIKNMSEKLENSEESLLEADDRVAADLVEGITTAVDFEEAAEEKRRIIEEHNKRVMQSPEFKAQVMYENYISGQILDGPTKRRLRKQFLRDAKKGKFDYLFDEEKIASRQQRAKEKFEALNRPVVHKVEELDENTQATLKEMANMEVIKPKED